MTEIIYGLADNTPLSPINVNSLPGSSTSGGLGGTNEIQLVLQIVFGIVGALALLFITISGLRYIISNGDPQKIKQAKEGIIYALVGLTIALTAEAIVTFLVGHL